MGNRSVYFNYIGIYVFAYAAAGSLLPFIGQYLSSLGLTGTQVGIVTGGGIVTAVIVAPFWGSFFQRCRNGKHVMGIICIGAAFAGLLMLTAGSFLTALILYGFLYFFYSGFIPLADAITLEKNYSFGATRKWGAMGFGAGVFLAGIFSEALGLAAIFFMFSLFYLFTGCFIMNIIRKDEREKPTDIYSKKRTERRSYRELFGNKKYMALLSSAFFFNGTCVAHNTYFGFLYTQAGGTIAGIGIIFFLMVISEAPFMAWSESLADRFTLEKTILAAMILSACRFLWYGTGPAPIYLFVTFFLQGMVNGILLVEFVRYINKLVDKQIIGMATTLYMVVSTNCGTIFCQLIGGRALDLFGGQGVYIIFGIFNGIGIFLYVISGLHRSEER